MEEEIKHINPDCPVYISYARNKNDEDLECDVNKLCELMDANAILYKRDNGEGKKCSVPYRYNIDEAEKEIGKGDIIVVVLSIAYLRSLHCMYEWHCICKTGNIAKRVFLIMLPDVNLIDDDTYQMNRNFLDIFYKQTYKKNLDEPHSIDKKEKELINNKGYLRNLETLRNYLRNHNITNVELLRENNYSPIIKQIKNDLTSAIKHREQDDKNQHVGGNEVTKVNETVSPVETQEDTNSFPASSLSVEECERLYERLTERLSKKLLKDNWDEIEEKEKDTLLTNNFILVIRSLEKLKEIVMHHKELKTKFFNFLCNYIRTRTKIQNNEIFIKEVEWLSRPYTYKIEKLLPYDIQLAINMLFKDCRELFAPIQEKVDFSCLDLKCSKFLGMEVKNINFSQSMLQCAKMYQYKEDGVLQDGELQDDKPVESTFENCIFDNAFLDASNMSMATFNNCSFIDTNMRWANMFGVKLNHCQFIGCQMTGVLLSEAHISDCTFENCKINAAELMNVHIETNVVMKNCSFCFAFIYSGDIDNNMDKFEACNFDEVEKNIKYYEGYSRIKRFLLHQQNILINEDVINETTNNRNIKDKKKTYYATLKEIRDYCLPNNVKSEDTEVRFFIEGQYDKIKI